MVACMKRFYANGLYSILRESLLFEKGTTDEVLV